jgi:hypothetical protein
MWPLEKYARWDGKCWHQVDSDDGQLRLLIEVTINKICDGHLLHCIFLFLITNFGFLHTESFKHDKFWVAMVMEMLTTLHLI